MPEQPRHSIPDLIAALESEDAFERRDAQDHLLRQTHHLLGFEWSDPPEARAEAVARWKAWWKARTGKLPGRPGRAGGTSKTVDIKHAIVGLDQLKNALKGIPPEQLEAHLAQILQKMQAADAARSRCEECGEHRATVHVTEKDAAGTLQERNLCERCAKRQGDVPG